MKIILGLLSYLIQPVLWLAIIKMGLVYRNRLAKERSLFRSAVYGDFFEGYHFMKAGLLLGLGASIIGLLITVPLEWVLVYEALMLISLLIPTGLGSILGAIIAGIAVVAMPSMIVNVTKEFSRWGLHSGGNTSGMLLVISLIMMITGIFYRLNGGKFNSPRVKYNKRHNRTVSYQFNELVAIPFVAIVPGDWFVSHLPFWPVLNSGHHSYALLLIPLLIGGKLNVNRQLPITFFKMLSKHLMGLGILTLGLALVNYFVAGITLPLLVGLLVLVIVIAAISRHQDNRLQDDYSEVMDGIRIIGVQPETPAAKMALEVGDVILAVNGIAVTNEEQLYKALSANATYSKLKIRNREGQLKFTESAIFENSPHEIGIKTYLDIADD